MSDIPPPSVFPENHPILFDLESTGLPVACEKPVELAAHSLITGRDFAQRINPQIRISRGAGSIHGIRQKDLVSCPTFAEAWVKFIQWIRSQIGPNQRIILIAHNGIRYDFPMILCMLRRHNLEVLTSIMVLDTLQLVGEYLPHHFPPRSRRLGLIHQAITGQPLDGAHSALGDIHGMRPLWNMLMDHAMTRGINLFVRAVPLISLEAPEPRDLYPHEIKEDDDLPIVPV